MYDIILSFVTAFTLTYFAIPSIIRVALAKNLCDPPKDRGSHHRSIPTLGGLAIFAGTLFSIIFWTPFNDFGEMQYIVCAFIIIFLIGAKDDIIPMAPNKKLIGQLFACLILVFKSKVSISGLFGILGIYALPIWASALFSVFIILVIINAFNLIDGINGLSATIGILITTSLGSWFLLVHHNELAIIAFSLAGALIAFLNYNFTPARIFMGDTGSMLVGLTCATLVVKFIEYHNINPNGPYSFKAAPAIGMGLLILPLFDTLRVFVKRSLAGRSPFDADRNHIHHMLIDLGLSHMQATGILLLANIFFVIMVATLQDLGNMVAISIMLLVATLMTSLLFYFYNKQMSAEELVSTTKKEDSYLVEQ